MRFRKHATALKVTSRLMPLKTAWSLCSSVHFLHERFLLCLRTFWNAATKNITLLL